MELAPEDKVNMSLDDLIKAKRQSAAAAKKAAPASIPPPAGKGRNPRGQNKNQAKGGAPPTTAARPVSAKGRARGARNGRGENNMDIVPAVRQKVAQNIGEGRAKRAATANKKRGLNSTGRATQQQMDLGGAKEVVANRNRQNRRQSQGAVGSAPRGRPALTSTRQPIKNGLKISFKPADLGRTTDKSVALQIRAVLSKQRGEGGGVAARRGRGGGAGNTGILANSSRSVSAPGAGGGRGAGKGPKGGRGGARRT